MVNRSTRLEVILGLKDETKKGFESAGRGVEGFNNKLKGMRLQLLAVTAAVGAIAVGSIKSASDLEESFQAAEVTFKNAFGQVEDFAENTADAFNLSRRAAFEYTAQLGGIFNASGLAADASAEMSVEATKLAADLASFKNLEIDVALQKIRAGLVGEVEPLRTVGVLLNAASVEAKAMELGLADVNGEISEGAKVQARFAVIMEQLSDAQGDVARTSDSVANQARNVAQQFEDMRAEIGEQLLPVVAALLGAFADLISFFADMPASMKTAVIIVGGLAGALAAIGLVLPSLVAGFGLLAGAWTLAAGANALLTVSLWAQVAAWIAANAATGGLIIAIGAIITAVVLMATNWEKTKEIVVNVANAIFGAVESMVNGVIGFLNGLIDGFNKLGSVIGIEIDQISEVTLPKFEQALKDAADTSTEVANEVGTSLDKINEDFKTTTDTTQEWRDSVIGDIEDVGEAVSARVQLVLDAGQRERNEQKRARNAAQKDREELEEIWAVSDANLIAAWKIKNETRRKMDEEAADFAIEQAKKVLAEELKFLAAREDAAQQLVDGNRAAFEALRQQALALPEVIQAGAFVSDDRAFAARAANAAAERAVAAGLEVSNEVGALFGPFGGPPPLLPGMGGDLVTQQTFAIFNVAGSVISENELRGLIQEEFSESAGQNNSFDSFNMGANNATNFT